MSPCILRVSRDRPPRHLIGNAPVYGGIVFPAPHHLPAAGEGKPGKCCNAFRIFGECCLEMLPCRGVARLVGPPQMPIPAHRMVPSVKILGPLALGAARLR